MAAISLFSALCAAAAKRGFPNVRGCAISSARSSDSFRLGTCVLQPFSLPSALRTPNRRNRNARGAERLEVAMNGPLRNLELLRQFALRDLPAGLEQQQDRHQSIGFHRRFNVLGPSRFFFLTF
jgi:hypothetical protein